MNNVIPFIADDSAGPILDESRLVLLTFSVMLTRTKRYAKRDILRRSNISFNTWAEAKKLTPEEKESLRKFFINAKIPFGDLRSILGDNLNSPVDLVISYSPTKYVKAFLETCDIPLVDLSTDMQYFAYMQNAIQKGTEACEALFKDFIRAHNFNTHYCLPQWSEDGNSFDFVPKERKYLA